MITSKTIVFIHGLFVNSKSWNDWKTFFEAQGYTCHAPDYPYHAGEPADLRKQPDPKLGKVTFAEVVDVYSKFIDTLPEKPILIGHSMGAFTVQKLMNMGKAAAGIAISSAPPRYIVTLKWSFIKSLLPVLNPFAGSAPFTASVAWFHYAFCNTMSLAETEQAHADFVVPESRNIARSSVLADGYVDFKKPHAPLLFIAGQADQIIPSILNQRNFRAYKDKNSKTDFKEFEGRTHAICNQKNWEEVATYINDWINTLP